MRVITLLILLTAVLGAGCGSDRMNEEQETAVGQLHDLTSTMTLGDTLGSDVDPKYEAAVRELMDDAVATIRERPCAAANAGTVRDTMDSIAERLERVGMREEAGTLRDELADAPTC